MTTVKTLTIAGTEFKAIGPLEHYNNETMYRLSYLVPSKKDGTTFSGTATIDRPVYLNVCLDSNKSKFWAAAGSKHYSVIYSEEQRGEPRHWLISSWASEQAPFNEAMTGIYWRAVEEGENTYAEAVEGLDLGEQGEKPQQVATGGLSEKTAGTVTVS